MFSSQDIMQLIGSLIWLLAGVGVFIVGMNFLSDALEKSAGSGMKRLLEKISNNRFSGVGIGAGVKVDGQILVYADMLGMTADFAPKFLRRYADLNTVITDAVGSYVSDVKACDFPNENEQY